MGCPRDVELHHASCIAGNPWLDYFFAVRLPGGAGFG
jgi:hypothetical protein